MKKKIVVGGRKINLLQQFVTSAQVNFFTPLCRDEFFSVFY
jgi:hypothetical protein